MENIEEEHDEYLEYDNQDLEEKFYLPGEDEEALNAVTLRNLNKSQVTLLKLIAASSKDSSINRQIFFFSRMCFL